MFVNASKGAIVSALERVRLDLLQFHGDETPDACERYGIPYIKALSMRPGVEVMMQAKRFDSACGLLLDAWHHKLRGGSGHAFDWSLVPTQLGLPVILAGGLDSSNVRAAIREVNPFAVDVSGGVEASKGIKDTAKMAAFIEEVNMCLSTRDHSRNQGRELV